MIPQLLTARQVVARMGAAYVFAGC